MRPVSLSPSFSAFNELVFLHGFAVGLNVKLRKPRDAQRRTATPNATHRALRIEALWAAAGNTGLAGRM